MNNPYEMKEHDALEDIDGKCTICGEKHMADGSEMEESLGEGEMYGSREEIGRALDKIIGVFGDPECEEFEESTSVPSSVGSSEERQEPGDDKPPAVELDGPSEESSIEEMVREKDEDRNERFGMRRSRF